jgi:hypothetical protein
VPTTTANMGFVSNLQDVMITFANVPPDIQAKDVNI